MSVQGDCRDLREQLVRLAREADEGLPARYALRPLPWEKPGLYRRLRRAIGHALRSLGLREAAPLEPWVTTINYVDYADAPRPLLIWAVGLERDALRTACCRFEGWCAATHGWAPVLVTDVDDFAFFSRLSWLVEYVPTLSSPAEGYRERKQRYLAWRYRGMPAVPAAAGLEHDGSLEELLIG